VALQSWQIKLADKSVSYWFRIFEPSITFIRALESSPVHCLKPLPSGKRRRPANGGAIAILDIYE